MKIVFLCGSLEPGRDGVGDYTRCLAAELIGQGHNVNAVSLYDSGINIVVSEKQHLNCIDVPVLRLPSALPVRKRMALAKEWIDEFEPEWLSLQFVIFSFQAKGLPLRLNKFLKKLGKGRKWHIMFHELWVGQDTHSPHKYVWWGWVQQRLIQYLVSKLKPDVVHTQSRLYQELLSKIGIVANYLPLFSNIPVLYKTSHKNDTPKTSAECGGNVVLVIFGTIHPGAPVYDFAKEAANYEMKNRLNISLLLVGRCGDEQNHWAAVWKAEGLKIKLMGEMAVESVSEILGAASFGISTTPLGQIEKSGTVAAMRAHNLPVINVARTWKARGVEDLGVPSGIVEYRKGNLEECLNIKVENLENISVSEISRAFANSF